MNRELFLQAKRLFLEAVKIAPQNRATWLTEHCGGNSTLRHEVDALLQADATEAVVDMPAVGSDFGKTLLTAAATPLRVGEFRILGLLGAGGMGEVYEAEQAQPRRRVALKVIRDVMLTQGLIDRFRHEAQVLALLQHDGIAKIYETGLARVEGVVPSDRDPEVPFIAMELIRGEPISQYARHHQLTVAEIVDLFADVCDAVQHAHQVGIVHRDLKPGNILIQPPDTARTDAVPTPQSTLVSAARSIDLTASRSSLRRRPQPKIIDFGVARLTAEDPGLQTLHTRQGQIIGTIPYMSPEQIGGQPDDIEARADVYALGVILFELLTGRLPYELPNRSIVEAARVIRETEPIRPTSLRRELRGDLQTILLKALEKSPGRRYPTAAALADDLRRFRLNQPITARRPSTLYLTQKFVRRHRTLVAGTVATLLALTLGLIGTTVYAMRAVRERDVADQARKMADQQSLEAQRQAANAEATLAFLTNDLLAAVDPSNAQGRELTVREALDAAAARLPGRFPNAPLIEAALRYTLGETYLNLDRTAEAERELQRALALRTAALGPDHLDTLRVASAVGVLLEQENKPAESLAVRQDILRRAEQNYGHDHQRTLAARNDLADLLSNVGRSAEAAVLFRDLAATRERLDGPRNEGTLSAWHNLAASLDELGQYPEAEQIEERVVELRRATLGPRHPQTLASITNLGMTRIRARRYEQGIPLLIEAAEGTYQVLGPQHRYTITRILNLGIGQQNRGCPLEAQEQFERALLLQSRAFGPDHPVTITTRGNLAWNRVLTGSVAEGATQLAAVYEQSIRVLGPQNWKTAYWQARYGGALARLGDCEQAEGLLQSAYLIFQAANMAESQRGEFIVEQLRLLYSKWPEAAEQR